MSHRPVTPSGGDFVGLRSSAPDRTTWSFFYVTGLRLLRLMSEGTARHRSILPVGRGFFSAGLVDYLLSLNRLWL